MNTVSFLIIINRENTIGEHLEGQGEALLRDAVI